MPFRETRRYIDAEKAHVVAKQCKAEKNSPTFYQQGRQALGVAMQVQEHAGQSPYPPTIGHVTDAITFNTPHGGPKDLLAILACGGCKHSAEVKVDSELMQELRNYGRNPQTSAGWTSWTAIGSECDPVMYPKSSIDMDASHTIVYAYDETHNTCYDHSAALHDTLVVRDAAQFYCDTTDPENSPCGTDYKQVRSSTWKSRINGFVVLNSFIIK